MQVRIISRVGTGRDLPCNVDDNYIRTGRDLSTNAGHTGTGRDLSLRAEY